MSLGGTPQYCLLQEWFSWAPPYARVPDGHVEEPEGSHQRAVHDDLGHTSYVHRQECLDLVIDISPFQFNTLNVRSTIYIPCFLCTIAARSNYNSNEHQA